MRESLVDVVIPTCNRNNLLLEALDSVLLQSYKANSILIVNNGSKILKYDQLPPHQNICIFNIPPFSGASYARNVGALNSQAEYLSFLDDDDFWHPDFLRESLSSLLSTSADACYGEKKLYTSNKTIPYKKIEDKDLQISSLLRNNPGVGGINLVVKASSFHSVGGFDNSLYRANDRAFALDLLLANKKIIAAPNAISIVRDHSYVRLRNSTLPLLSFYSKYRKELGILNYFILSLRVIIVSIKTNITRFFK